MSQEGEKPNLREMLTEWARYEPDLCEVRGDGSAQIVIDHYYEELESDPIDGTCGRSRVEALVFSAVCSVVERRHYDTAHHHLYPREGQQLQHSFRARRVDGETHYTALIVWTNPEFGEHAIAYGAESDDTYVRGRGGTMLEAYLKLLRHEQFRRNEWKRLVERRTGP